jgi:hypothetical protein
MSCEKQDELREAITGILQRIDALTQEQIDAIKTADDAELMALDKAIELTFGEKERALGLSFSTGRSMAVNPSLGTECHS